ncbi:MAG TPA: hypothetical protein VK249_13725 [Anaerolineales bacterium]|nr:hypothetical protein [Anaerolineales bacterium]
MPPRPNARNWNDVQTAIATVAIVTTLGMWNLFATPVKTKTVQTQEPVIPPTEPPTEAPTEPPVAADSAAMPQVKIMFTPNAPVTTTVVQQSQQTQTQKKKKKNKSSNSSGGGGGGAVTQTRSS